MDYIHELLLLITNFHIVLRFGTCTQKAEGCTDNDASKRRKTVWYAI